MSTTPAPPLHTMPRRALIDEPPVASARSDKPDKQATWLAGRLRPVLLSAIVWFLYVPHYTVLSLLGPRYGFIWVRLAARVHWLLTFVGAQRATRRALKRMHRHFDCPLSVSAILRKHLEMKHDCFARVRVYNLHGDKRSMNDLRFELNENCRSAVPTMEGRKRGLIVVGFHFGFFQMCAAVLPRIMPGYQAVQLRYRNAQCADQTMAPVARLVLRKALEADRRSGASIFYVDADTSLLPLYRLLRKGGCATVAADGMLADEFVDVPFFDGRLRVPSGWARLAAATGSDALVIVDQEVDRGRRDVWFFDAIRCAENSDEAARHAVAEAIQALEGMIRQEPWGWHPWQRLCWETESNGSPRYHLEPFRCSGSAGPQERSAVSKATCPRPNAAGFETSSSDENADVPRVAIVCNSLTPYRIHLHERITAEIPEVELWSLSTHANAYQRWTTVDVPSSIRPIDFNHGEPTNEQTQLRHSLREWRKAGRIIRWLKDHRAAAVFCQGCGDVGRLRVLRWCRRNGVPCYLTGDFNVRGDKVKGLKRFVKRLVYGRAVAWASGLMPCGRYGRELLERYGGDGKPSFAFPFLPDITLFQNTPDDAVSGVRHRFDLGQQRRRIVFSARMMAAKRPDLALDAFLAIADQRPDWDLIMLGDGQLRAPLETSVPPDLKNRILWTGLLNDMRDVAGIYAQSDALLLPSDHEPWGVVVVEAAAAGLAIVASDVVGAAPELVQEGRNGTVFAASDVHSLTQALLNVTERARIDQYKRQSRIVVEQWLAYADPVAGFRDALSACGVLNDEARATPREASDQRCEHQSLDHAPHGTGELAHHSREYERCTRNGT